MTDLAVHHVAVLVSDLERAEAFYRHVLGLPVVRRWNDDLGVPRSVWMGLVGAFLAIEKGTPQQGSGGSGWHCVALAIAAQEREPWRARLHAAGVTIERETDHTLYFRDPDGNLIGVTHYPNFANNNTDLQHASSRAPSGNPVLGVFVGGKSVRMNGRPKGLLTAPDTGEAIVEKLARLGREVDCEVVLIGDASEYTDIAPSVLRLNDDIVGIGPLGGLLALLRYAGSRGAIAVGCDMPFVTLDALHSLASHPAHAAILAPQRNHGWEPLFARYDSPLVLPILEKALAENVRSFQEAFSRLDVAVFEVDSAILVDWDEPGDVVGSTLPT